MDGHIRSEVHSIALVEQLTELVGTRDDVAALVDSDPTAPVPLDEFALHSPKAKRRPRRWLSCHQSSP